MTEEQKPQLSLESLQALIEKQNETIANLQGQLLKSQTDDEAPKALSIPKEAVKIGGKEYKWNVAAFSFPGSAEKISAEEASLDSEVLAKILKIDGQGLLSELV